MRNSELSYRSRKGHLGRAAGNPSAPSGQLPLHKGAFFQLRHPTASLTPNAAYPHKQGAVFNCPGTPNLFRRRSRGDAQEGNTSWVLFGSFSQRERTITSSALRKSCRQLQPMILSQRSQVHTAQVTPLKPSRHTPCARGETQNTQALPQNIRPHALSVTCGDSSPRGRAKAAASGGELHRRYNERGSGV